jgi:LysR family transcriptional regulator, low CO2-responsive transcriptional regulator
MEIDQLKTFLAVAAQGGFRRASEVLNVTQPAVSSRIQALEDSLGASLFARGGAKLALTPAGKTLRPYAEQVLREIAQARQAVHELQPTAAGALRIASALSICTYFLPDVLKRYQIAHRKTMVTVRAGHSKEVLKMVLDGEADMGLARALNHPDIETTTLRDDPLILTGHPQHPQAQRPEARLEDVEGWPLIFYDRGSSDWTLTQGLFRRAGLLPNVALEVASIEAAKRMVERGLGLGFLPLIAVTQELRSGKLRAIAIVDAEPLHRNLDVIHLRHQPLTPEAMAFLKLLRVAAAQSLEPFSRVPRRAASRNVRPQQPQSAEALTRARRRRASGLRRASP